jgi:hypothetical protein
MKNQTVTNLQVKGNRRMNLCIKQIYISNQPEEKITLLISKLYWFQFWRKQKRNDAYKKLNFEVSNVFENFYLILGNWKM